LVLNLKQEMAKIQQFLVWIIMLLISFQYIISQTLNLRMYKRML